MNSKLFAAASLVAMMVAGPALAQDAAPAQDDAGIQDIVVTAQRVSESAQKAPVAISVVKSEDLLRENVTRPEELQRLVPALVATTGGGPYSSFFLRGVGNATLNAYSDPGVAFNYDGVYIGRPSSTSGTFYDLQRVEVLKGPQGTLYGRNATGGAINVIPNRPKVGETSAEAMASYGNYDALLAQGAVNLPIGDSGAFRLSGNYASHDAYLDDGTGDQKEWGLRGQFYADLTPDLNVRVSADYAHQGGVGSYSTYVGDVTPNFGPMGFTGYTFTPSGFSPKQGILDPASRAYLAGHYVAQIGRVGEVTQGYPYNNNGYWGVLAEVNWKIGGGTLTIQPAYREADLNNLFLDGMNGAETDEHDQQFSLEARYAGSAGPIDYLLGGYYFNERIKASTYFSQFTLVPYQDFTNGTDSYAAFGKLTAHIGSKLSLTAAGRYTKDKKRFDGVSDTYILFCGNPAAFPPNSCPTLPFIPLVRTAAELRAFYASQGVPVTPVPLYVLPPFLGGSQTAPFVLNAPIAINSGLKNDKFTYRLAAEYEFSPQSMVYASFETGYHSGGFAFARGLETYRPETIDAWTVGSKNRFLGNRLQLNLEGFYWKYKDQQFSQFGYDLGTPPATVFLTRNIGSATIYGLDADVQALVTKNTLLSANVQYLHTKYDSFVYFLPNQGLPPVTACPTAPTTQTINGSTVAVFRVDCSGMAAINAPEWTFNLNAQQTVPLGATNLVLQAGTRYRSDALIDPNYSPYFVGKAGFVSNASITFSSADDRWFVTAFINNVENFRRLQRVTLAQSASVYTGGYEAPRTFGVRIGGRFR